MRYSIELKDRIYVKGYGYLSFAKNMGKSFSNKYGQKHHIVLKNAMNGCNEDCFKKSNLWWATGDLIGNKIADKSSKSSPFQNTQQSCAEKMMMLIGK